jgi:transcriptional regulator with XRE-family HTH domain
MAQVINGHWTNDSIKAFLFRIAFDFVTQLEKLMEAEKVTPTELAKRLGVTKGRVSQIMNNPGNMKLKTIVEWARALDVKVAIVAYDDGDVDNDNGPVNPQIFVKCWEKADRPTDFFAAEMVAASTIAVEVDPKWVQWKERISPDGFDAGVDPWDGVDPVMVPQPVEDGAERYAGTYAN